MEIKKNNASDFKLTFLSGSHFIKGQVSLTVANPGCASLSNAIRDALLLAKSGKKVLFSYDDIDGQYLVKAIMNATEKANGFAGDTAVAMFDSHHQFRIHNTRNPQDMVRVIVEGRFDAVFIPLSVLTVDNETARTLSQVADHTGAAIELYGSKANPNNSQSFGCGPIASSAKSIRVIRESWSEHARLPKKNGESILVVKNVKSAYKVEDSNKLIKVGRVETSYGVSVNAVTEYK